MPIGSSTIAQVSNNGVGSVRVKSVHTDHLGKKHTLRRSARDTDDHEASKPKYAALMLEQLEEREAGRFARHLKSGGLPQDFTRNHISVLQGKYVLLRVFMKEDRSAVAVQMAQEITDHISDAEIESSPLKEHQKSNVRPRAANLLSISAALQTDSDHVGAG